MDTRKHYEFFNPNDSPPIHIIGCGAIGSTIATQVARLGIDEIHLWDFDHVESKNIANQTFNFRDIGRLKTETIRDYINNINPGCKVHLHEEYTDQILHGIVFTTVDSILVRKNIIKINRYNREAVAYIDVRMGLTSGQVYTATFLKQSSIKSLLESMNFTDEEAKASTPVSACGTVLNVRPNVTALSSYAVAELMHIIKNKQPKNKLIMADVYHQTLNTIEF